MEYGKSLTDGLQFLWGQGFLSPGGPEEIAVILSGVDLAGQRVLDIGSGLGGIDLLLVTRFGAGHVTGIDIEPTLVAAATESARKAGLSAKVTFQSVTPGALPFPDASFDTVFSKDAMVHVHDKLGLYREIRRVLRPGGTFRAGDWLWAANAETDPAVIEWLGSSPLHFAYTTPDEAHAALTAAGLDKVRVADKRIELQASNREVLARLQGPDFADLVALVGREQAEERLAGTIGRQTILDGGQLIPCHLSGTRPPS